MAIQARSLTSLPSKPKSLDQGVGAVCAEYIQDVTHDTNAKTVADQNPNDSIAQIEALYTFERADAVRGILVVLGVSEGRIAELEAEACFGNALSAMANRSSFPPQTVQQEGASAYLH